MHLIPYLADQWVDDFWGVYARARLRLVNKEHAMLDSTFVTPTDLMDAYRTQPRPIENHPDPTLNPTRIDSLRMCRDVLVDAAYIGWHRFHGRLHIQRDIDERPKLLLGLTTDWLNVTYPPNSPDQVRIFIGGGYNGLSFRRSVAELESTVKRVAYNPVRPIAARELRLLLEMMPALTLDNVSKVVDAIQTYKGFQTVTGPLFEATQK